MVIDFHAKNQVNICKHLEKKSKAHNFTKNQWSIMKLKLNLYIMVIDLHAKNQVEIGKKVRKTV